MKTYCAICEELVVYSEIENCVKRVDDGISPPRVTEGTGSDFLLDGRLQGHQENGRDYCAKCWNLR